MAGFDWKSLVRTVAPVIGTALGGPLAGMATRAISTTLLGKPDADEEELSAAIQGATPEQLTKLREADNNFKVQMKQLDIDLEKINATDRASARELAIKTSLFPQVIISGIFITCFGAVLYQVFTGETVANAMNKDIIIYLLGILSAGITQIMNFFFGSSAGSKNKDTTMANKVLS